MSAADAEATEAEVGSSLRDVMRQWRHLCWQHMRTTYVSHGNTLLAPLVGLILCVPHFIDGTMLLGDVTQAAAAFVAVQGAFNWLIDNFPRLAECLSSPTGWATCSWPSTASRRPRGRPPAPMSSARRASRHEGGFCATSSIRLLAGVDSRTAKTAANQARRRELNPR
jgi:hypothetical protein